MSSYKMYGEVKSQNCVNYCEVSQMEAKPIFNSYIAKQLVLMGNKIVDLQPDKKRKGSIIFYFEKTQKLIDDFYSVNKKISSD